MVEEQAGFLCSLASTLKQNDELQTLLRSYYLMRCKDISRGFGLPEKQFSSNTRCPSCCVEWKHGTDSKIKAIKLSKRQRHRRKSSKQGQVVQKNLLCSNQLVSTCSLCKKETITILEKPERKLHKLAPVTKAIKPRNIKENPNKNTVIKKQINDTKEKKKPNLLYAYSNAKDIFSLKNDSNSIPKEKPKVIKNNKKKKDKFAGLCQQAVISAAKQKKNMENHNTAKKKDQLSLFLKPSS